MSDGHAALCFGTQAGLRPVDIMTPPLIFYFWKLRRDGLREQQNC